VSVVMAQTPEGLTKKKIKLVLDKYKNYGIYKFMAVPYGYGQSTLDYLGFFFGRGYAIEAKAPGEVPTPRQERIIEAIQASGTPVFVIDGVNGELEKLDAWLGARAKGSD
jgi:hypothetical protein